ncbi:MAG: carbohydrate ABC transporter permease [Anaerolineae bacterium]|nr:carbohydrate ABC transporter permease [Anaerolineae bacterium]
MTQSKLALWFRTGISLYAPVIIALLITLFPFYWMFITSLKDSREIFNLQGPILFVQNPTLDNYKYLFESTLFSHWMINSVVIASITTVFSVFVSIIAGYAIARLRFRGASLLAILIFITYLVPKTLLFIPLAQVLSQLQILGEPATLLLTYPTFLIPFCTWLLTGYFRTIPNDLEECARIDGCTRVGAMARITLPLAIPGILTAAIFSFTLSWNDLLYSLAFVNGDANKTLPLGATSSLMVNDYFFWGPLMAASVLASIPVAILYFFFVDLYVGGLTAGAVKG